MTAESFLKKRIAILALQGAFAEQSSVLHKLGAEPFLVRDIHSWNQHKDGLIIPGGESTVMVKLLNDLNLLEPIRNAIEEGLPVYGTCAGMIVLAKMVENDTCSSRIATMNVCVRRNAYGRQLGSFATEGYFAGNKTSMVFIRAPYITHVGEGVEILSEVNGEIVAARQSNQLVTSFHPELTSDMQVHRYFLEMIFV